MYSKVSFLDSLSLSNIQYRFPNYKLRQACTEQFTTNLESKIYGSFDSTIYDKFVQQKCTQDEEK